MIVIPYGSAAQEEEEAEDAGAFGESRSLSRSSNPTEKFLDPRGRQLPLVAASCRQLPPVGTFAPALPSSLGHRTRVTQPSLLQRPTSTETKSSTFPLYFLFLSFFSVHESPGHHADSLAYLVCTAEPAYERLQGKK